jgi:integrase
VEYPNGYYQLRFYVGSKVKYERVQGEDSEALAAVKKKELSLKAEDAAQDAGATLVEEPSRMSLQRQLDRFLEVVRDRRSLVAEGVYKLAVDDFLKVTGKTYADQLSGDDMRHYLRSLRSRKLSERTLHNRWANVKAFFIFCGLTVKELAPDAPKYDKTLPEVYTPEQITAFLSSLSEPYHRVVFSLMLMCGLRDQEAMFLCWSDVNFSSGMLRVTSKPDLGFRVKDKEERDVPVPDDLLQLLKDWKAERQNTRLVIGLAGDKPNTKLLRLLKRLVKKAGLNCGECETCRERGECEVWFLHKFRATYCTKLLRSGMDVRTVQALLGHSDVATTMKYARPHEADAVRGRIAAINWGEN